ncbi:hypothetical protein PICMEDRAFT_77876 [Pichia membranifaciens NRRL Y-2026]|uniref:SH3 domain-containing protein n=1 Tax=Pichia membranifaciens NRRL Y-2026 TaxID=763406 RepID=A0A1E3NL66_9ASCO|nr:hypothetical protein PICMEDRAFT_77876 [Pichia membranifaciens NRRL Y-2026]ODQ46861.1 hypothetical protein PICMEDRAFT_77876 [Pichia membranifaciens NRRL Y-2026]
MDTQQIARLSRRDLQSLHTSLDNLSDFNIESYGRDSFSSPSLGRSASQDGGDEDDELDDFALHNLKDLRLAPHGFSRPSVRDPDTQSNSSSSAASTVIHNPNSTPPAGADDLVNSVSLRTLESDPELQNKLHRTLRLSNTNNNNNNNKSLEPGFYHTGAQDACRGDEQASMDEIDYYQNEHDGDNGNEDDDDEEVDDDIGSSNSLDSMEDITNDKLTDYIQGMLPSPPSSPPKELDPTKLYALYDFSGPDPSHLPLLKNESVLLLNDSDSYWWLVRKVDNNRIGFAPAEILETYTERLARLNCWKNEILERGGIAGLKIEEEKKLFNTDYPLNHPLLESIPLVNSAMNNDSVDSVDNKIERKGSLKKPKHGFNYISTDSTKKTVSFADVNEVKESSDLENNDDEEDEEFDKESIDRIQERGEHAAACGLIDGIDENEETSYSLLEGYQNEYSIEESSIPVRSEGLPHEPRNGHDHTQRYNSKDDWDNADLAGTQPLIVPKKRRNFLIKNLDDYQYSSDEKETDARTQELEDAEEGVEQVKASSRSPEVLTPSSSANGNSLESTPTKLALNNVTASTCSDSTDSLQKGLEFKERKTQDLSVAKTRSTEKTAAAGETRLASLKMLDDLLDTYPEFVGHGKDSSTASASASNSGSSSMTNESGTKDVKAQGLAEGYRSSSMSSDIKMKSLLVPELDETETESEFSKSKGSLHMRSDSSIEGDDLHPKTMLIFDPLFNQIKELDALLDEIKR